MRIIIAGVGDVGFHVAKELSAENHDIIAIDTDSQRLKYVESLSDIMTINGSSTSIEVLEDARVGDTDVLLAVTSKEEVNIFTAILGKKLGAKKTVVRVGNGEFVSPDCKIDFRELGIDFLIYPEEIAAKEMVKLIKRSAATDVLEFEGGKLLLLGLRLDKDSPIINKTLAEVTEEYSIHDYRVTAIHRAQRTIIPSGKDKFLANDQIFVITRQQEVESMLSLVGKKSKKFDQLMILGGGKIGMMTAQLLEDEMSIKLIEPDKEKSYALADKLHNTLVINADGRDLDLLAQEGIIDMDAFLAVTDDAETNIISCLMAKHLGVKKVIAVIDKAEYIPLTQTIGLDSLINKKLIAANNIYRFLRRGKLLAVESLFGIDAEVYEFIVKANSKATKNQIKNLKFPKNGLIGGYIRSGEGYIAVGETHLQTNDKVVVFGFPENYDQLESYFS